MQEIDNLLPSVYKRHLPNDGASDWRAINILLVECPVARGTAESKVRTGQRELSLICK